MLASLSSGFGEMTFLMLTSHYKPTTVSAWSSGTGGAGIIGALSFLVLTSWWNISVRTSLNLFSLLPAIMALTYFFILAPGFEPPPTHYLPIDNHSEHAEVLPADEDDGILTSEPKNISFREKLSIVKSLIWRFLAPMFLVYFAEYTINMGIAPTLLFPLAQTPFYELRDHYITYAFTYQLGVFISRSSVSIFPIRHVWIPSLLQVGLLVVFFSQAFFSWMPGVYFVLGLIVIEGLLGGTTYVNTYNNIRTDGSVALHHKEFSMGVVGVADSLGIAFAGLFSLWTEPFLCQRNPICRNQ